ncbi:Psh1 [Kluyveromyces lactis]|nr:Psh1 [Kluyveromyces lactis]
MNGHLHTVIPKKSNTDHLRILGRVLDSTVCTICHDYMFVPVMTNCGHNYCYECLNNWLNNNRSNVSELTCPQCRNVITNEPSLNVALQQIVDLMLDIAAEDPQISNSSEVRSLLTQRECSVAEYKSDLLEETLFNSVFKNTAKAIIDDDDDGIARCSNCQWEVEGPVCPNCNATIRNYNAGAQNFDEVDVDEYSDGELEEVERDLDNYRAESARTMHDLEAEEGDESLSSEMDQAWPTRRPRNFMRGEEEEEEEEDRGSIDSFIVDEEEEEEEEEQELKDERKFRRASVALSDDDDNESRDSDFYEHNDDGYASGDSLDESTSNDELEPHTIRLTHSQDNNNNNNNNNNSARKKRLIVLDSDE